MVEESVEGLGGVGRRGGFEAGEVGGELSAGVDDGVDAGTALGGELVAVGVGDLGDEVVVSAPSQVVADLSDGHGGGVDAQRRGDAGRRSAACW